MEKEILEIAALVDRLRREDTNFRVFGADSHKYRIGPTLSEAEIREFEQKHEIVLPADYRLWLRLVGDGSGRTGRWPIKGVGPNYGIYHLRDTTVESIPSKPFAPYPFRRPELLPKTGDVELFEIDLEDDDNESICGVLNLGTRGCAYETILVVNGQEQGKMWESWSRTEVWTDGFTFSGWVRNWAERALPLVIRDRVTNVVEVGMNKAQAIAICGDDFVENTDCVEAKMLRFEGFATQFYLDESDYIVRIIKSVIGGV